MKVSEAAKGLFTTKIEIGHFFELQQQDIYIVLRELTDEEGLEHKTIWQEDIQENKFKKLEYNKQKLIKQWSGCLIEHNLDDDNNKPAQNSAVIQLIQKSYKCVDYITGEWGKSLFLARASDGKSDNLQSTSSTEAGSQEK
jgi:hypothetical protein